MASQNFVDSHQKFDVEALIFLYSFITFFELDTDNLISDSLYYLFFLILN